MNSNISERNTMFTTSRLAALFLLVSACDVAQPNDTTPEPATLEQAIIGCPPPKPAAPDCYRTSCSGNEWVMTPLANGAACSGGICNAAHQCVRSITAPAINNLSMYTPTQVQYDLKCATGQTPTTTIVKVNIDNGPVWTTLPPYCQYYGSGHVYDSYNVRPGQQRCYAVTASNSVGSSTGTTRCITTPQDYVPPAAPMGFINRYPGNPNVVLTIMDQSTNETLLRIHARRANVGAAWQTVCTIARGYPHAGTGESYQCAMNNLELGVTYEARFEAFHDRADLSTFYSPDPFQPLPPIPAVAPFPWRNHTTDTTITFSWNPVEYATSYRIYKSGLNAPQGGPMTFLTSVSGMTFTVTGLPPSSYFCFDVTAANESGESPHSLRACAETEAGPPQKRQQSVLLYKKTDPVSGQVMYRYAFSANGLLDSLELRSEDNGPGLAGLITTWGVVNDATPAVDGNDCKLSANAATFTDADGALQGPKLGALYDGDEHPSLRGYNAYDLLTRRFIGGCPVFTASQAQPPESIRVVVHYTGY